MLLCTSCQSPSILDYCANVDIATDNVCISTILYYWRPCWHAAQIEWLLTGVAHNSIAEEHTVCVIDVSYNSCSLLRSPPILNCSTNTNMGKQAMRASPPVHLRGGDHTAQDCVAIRRRSHYHFRLHTCCAGERFAFDALWHICARCGSAFASIFYKVEVFGNLERRRATVVSLRTPNGRKGADDVVFIKGVEKGWVATVNSFH